MKIPCRLTHHRGRTLASLICCLVWLAGLSPTKTGTAQMLNTSIITVNTTMDELINNGNCSLREAVQAANEDAAVDACPAGSGEDAIILGAGTYYLTLEGANEDGALTGDLDITESVSIIGTGTTTTLIDGNTADDRIFDTFGTSTLKISFLTLCNGRELGTSTDGGGAIRNNESSTLYLYLVNLHDNITSNLGGAIYNAGYARLDYVTLEGNTSITADPSGFGGAIYNLGFLVVNTSLISNNTAGDPSRILGYGGGIFNDNILTLTNVTFSGNTAWQGGGLHDQGSVANLSNITFTENSTAINNQSTKMQITNSIVANSTGLNCYGDNPVSLGYNIDDDGSCGFTATGDLTGANPLLEPLADNYGPTLTHALQAASPAIDSANTISCPLIDQRGALRPADGNGDGFRHCDIGAYEMQTDFATFSLLPIIKK